MFRSSKLNILFTNDLFYFSDSLYNREVGLVINCDIPKKVNS